MEMSNITLLKELEEMLHECEIDYKKALNLTSQAAAGRVRKKMQRVRELTRDIRKEMSVCREEMRIILKDRKVQTK